MAPKAPSSAAGENFENFHSKPCKITTAMCDLQQARATLEEVYRTEVTSPSILRVCVYGVSWDHLQRGAHITLAVRRGTGVGAGCRHSCEDPSFRRAGMRRDNFSVYIKLDQGDRPTRVHGGKHRGLNTSGGRALKYTQ